MRTKLPLVLIAAFMLGAVVIAPAMAEETPPEGGGPATPLAGTCGPNLICAFGQPNYLGVEYVLQCSNFGNFPLGGNYGSAKNRCGNKKNKLYFGGTEVACMNPGGDRPNPGTFNNIYIPEAYGTFC